MTYKPRSKLGLRRLMRMSGLGPKDTTRTYREAIATLRAMVAWHKTSNGALQYLRVADCRRFTTASLYAEGVDVRSAQG